MKAEHRHELKTNELADWIAHFPQWARQNVATIAAVAAIIIVALGFYFWRGYSTNAQFEKKVQLTSLANQISSNAAKALQAQQQGKDLSFTLLQPADNLQAYAETTEDKHMAALALIKKAEALRTELHYRMSIVSKQDISEQVGKAQESYNEALALAPSDPILTGMAKYGLGLCAEELGDFEKARGIYQEIAEDPLFEATVYVPRAQYRLDIMDEYKDRPTFEPAPASARPLTTPQDTDLGPVGPLRDMLDTNAPTEMPDIEPNTPVSPVETVPEPAETAEPNETTDKAESAPEPNDPATTSDANGPGN